MMVVVVLLYLLFQYIELSAQRRTIPRTLPVSQRRRLWRCDMRWCWGCFAIARHINICSIGKEAPAKTDTVTHVCFIAVECCLFADSPFLMEEHIACDWFALSHRPKHLCVLYLWKRLIQLYTNQNTYWGI